jgi:hypothetical protein
VVAKNARLPDVCVKCGAIAGLTRKRRRLQYTPPWGFAFFGLIGFVGFPDPTLAMLGTLAPLLGLALVLATTRKAELELALCVRCKRRWTFAVIVLAFATLAPFLGLLAFIAFILRLFRAGVGPSDLVAGGVVLDLALLAPIVAHVAYAAPRLLGVKRIDAQSITLSRVHPTAVAWCSGQAIPRAS